MNAPVAASGESRAWIWGAGVTLAVVFFLASHDPLASLQWRQALPDEIRELVREVSEGRIERRLAFPLLGIAGVVALMWPRRLPFRRDELLAGLLVAFLGWQFLSVAWSADPLLTGKRLVVLGLMVIGAAGLLSRLSLAGLMRATVICTGLHLAAGVLAESLLGTFEPLRAGYRFAGTLHPNQQGINCALLVVTSAYLLRKARAPVSRATALGTLSLGLSFLMLTRSRTALAAGVLALLLFLLLDARPLRRIALAGGASTAFGLLLLLAANGILPVSGQALLLGREDSSLATLTGRTDIWSYAIQRFVERPISGYGYNSFWSARHTAEVSQVVDWKISEGHSAYLDTLLDLGAVGLLLFVALLGISVIQAVARHRYSRDPAFAAAAGILIFGALDGLLESAVVIPNLLSFLTLATIAALAFGGESARDALTPSAAVRKPVGTAAR